jgi:secreted PhoX family phosphatase
MYVADSPEDLVKGNGQLYVFGAEDNAAYNTWDDIYHPDGAVAGKFIPLAWDHSTQDEVDLNNEAIAAGGFQFIRPEDGATDKREGHMNILYMADTGNDVDENGAVIPPGSNGQTWERGRMYKFEFTGSSDPTKATFEVIMDGNDPIAPGYNADLRLAMSNPDNIDTSENSLVIQEDRVGVTRSPATGDITKNAKIIKVDLHR